MANVLILIHPYDRFGWRRFLLHLLAECWGKSGHHVVVRADWRNPPPADAVIVHVDLSVVPASYLEAANGYPVVVNDAMPDIRKRGYSLNLLCADDDYSGAVIVKSDLNSGGIPEYFKWVTSKRLGRSSGPPVRPYGPDYPVYPSMRKVPAEVWRDAGRVVEKFLPEIDGDSYCLRYYYFFGDAESCIRLRSREKVVKGANAGQAEYVPVPPELRALRRKMGLGYGKFDYVMRDGEVVLFDVNRTPSYSALEIHGQRNAVVAQLAQGLGSVLTR